MRIRRWFLHFLVSTMAALGAAVVMTLLLTLADLYLVGHGHQSINRQVLAWPLAGISLSPADFILLLGTVSAGCVAWVRLRRAI